MYMGNVSYWNDKFKVRGQELMQPEGCLVHDMPCLPKSGMVLDLACGDGRNALFLASHGYKVTAVDFSSVAIERLQRFALKKQLAISVLQRNLCVEKSYSDFGVFDLIVLNHYRLEENFYPILEQHLKKNGILWVNGFYEVPKDNPDIQYEDLMTPTDFHGLTGLTCEDEIIYEIDRKKFIRYIWRKDLPTE
ncbi:class I SAM-dependent methyltransferase [Paenibacillus sanguinis]|uniref:class I SAM-dependent methyltransferase n=1 Tax=Paenibacillus sanguinis TaxID=225906 RepID=UPI00035EEFB1|nr:class I SAM-dependent methyltransferase [Paenibacillus sanguinis]